MSTIERIDECKEFDENLFRVFLKDLDSQIVTKFGIENGKLSEDHIHEMWDENDLSIFMEYENKDNTFAIFIGVVQNNYFSKLGGIEKRKGEYVIYIEYFGEVPKEKIELYKKLNSFLIELIPKISIQKTGNFFEYNKLSNQKIDRSLRNQTNEYNKVFEEE